MVVRLSYLNTGRDLAIETVFVAHCKTLRAEGS